VESCASIAKGRWTMKEPDHNSDLQAEAFSPSLEELAATYRNQGEVNDRIHELLEQATWQDGLLSEHRKHIEENKLGFGDPAFHSMWARLLEAGVQRHGKVRALEIGVFKGQVISLWSLLAKAYGWPLEIFCVTPMAGNPLPPPGLRHRLRMICSWKYREQIRNGNFYGEENYREIIRLLFARFELPFDKITVFQGFSTEEGVLKQAENMEFEVVYVDGDHTFEGAMHDLRHFGPKVVRGGWMVVDDAGCALPGSRFWKGHEAVSRAVEILPTLGFRNILNVGHNRIYEKTAG
jgi:hypothetical protein